jgi:hypothetical protein
MDGLIRGGRLVRTRKRFIHVGWAVFKIGIHVYPCSFRPVAATAIGIGCYFRFLFALLGVFV